jgi:hypothetical protein
VKTDTILVMLKKKQAGKTWAYVTETEKLSKEGKRYENEKNIFFYLSHSREIILSPQEKRHRCLDKNLNLGLKNYCDDNSL